MRLTLLISPCLVLAALCGCSGPLPIETFAGSSPAFDPVDFFTGHVRSWGVRENRSGGPTGWVATDCIGEREGAGGLHMVQRLTMEDGTRQQRDWHMRRVGAHRYEATANDMAETAAGEARGRVFHWRWTLVEAGNPLLDVTMEQWMYLMANGAMLNRTIVSKLGITLAEVTEQFERVP